MRTSPDDAGWRRLLGCFGLMTLLVSGVVGCGSATVESSTTAPATPSTATTGGDPLTEIQVSGAPPATACYGTAVYDATVVPGTVEDWLRGPAGQDPEIAAAFSALLASPDRTRAVDAEGKLVAELQVQEVDGGFVPQQLTYLSDSPEVMAAC